MSDFSLSVPDCRTRQQRLLAEMERQRLDLVIVGHNAHVQWLTGCHFSWLFSPMAALSADGRCTLVAPARRMPAVAAADEVAPYEAQWHSTLRNDQRIASAEVLLDVLRGQENSLAAKPRRMGVDFSSCGPQVTGCQHAAGAEEADGTRGVSATLRPAAPPLAAALVDIEPTIYYLRRRKGPDELALMRKAIAATGRMYERARAIVAPSI